MTTDATVEAASPRVLATWYRTGRSDLDSHLSTHGPVSFRPRDRRYGADLVRAVAQSGLAGRGGAGFPTARKMEALSRSGRAPLVVVNGLEGEPASDKDAVLLARVPHLVLDGAELTAGALGAAEIAVCVADSRPDLALSLRGALAERSAAGLGGLPVAVHSAPGRYVSGEESALVHWLNGGPAMPSFRISKAIPLYIRRRPVLVHNAETMAHVALIARHGPHWFRSVGTPDAPGTALVTISGTVARPGVHELALGAPVGTMVAHAAPTQMVGAVLVGGFGGTWVTGDDLGTRYAAGPLASIGATPGVGVLACIGTSTCGVVQTARIVAYLAAESAGQCGPCRFGLPALANDLTAVARGDAHDRALERIRTRLDAVAGRGACGHPDGVVRLVRSMLAAFATDVAEHLRHRPCPASTRPPALSVPEPGAGLRHVDPPRQGQRSGRHR